MITREIVGYLHGLRELPPEVVDRGRYFLLDYLGCAIAGSRVESSQPVYRALAEGPCAVIGTGRTASPLSAALANGTAAHGVELDDTHNGGSVHLGAVMFPAALAVAEAHAIEDGSEFFTAVAAGYEMAARLAMAVQPKHHYGRGFHPTATCGVFGAAVTASKLLRLSEASMLSAVGIAGSMAAGSLEFLADGAWTKRLHAGLAAQNGIHAAQLAHAGFVGPATILEGRSGFLAAYSDAARPELVTRGLGESFAILETSVKPHACCRYKQGPIDALLEISAKHRVDARRIRRVEVAILEAGAGLIAEPPERKYEPRSIVDAQFSMPFGAAVALLRGRAGLGEYTEANLRDPDVRALMRKVVMTRDPALEANFPKEWPARVFVEMETGERYDASVRHPRGDPANPLSWKELGAKFRSLGGTAEIEECVRNITGLSRLLPLLRMTLGISA